MSEPTSAPKGSRLSSPDVARPDAYFTRPDVSILPAQEQVFHTRDPKSGGFVLDDNGEPVRRVLTIDDDTLQSLADDANERAARGDYCLVYLGHTILGEPDEQKQPVPIGFMRNYRVGPECDDDGNVIDERSHLVLDLVLEKKYEDTFTTYPHRSIEMVPNFADPTASRVRGLALLRRPPLYEMGLLTYSEQAATNYVAPASVPNKPDLPPANPTSYQATVNPDGHEPGDDVPGPPNPPESPAGDETMTAEDIKAIIDGVVAALKPAEAEVAAVAAADDDMPDAVADSEDTATVNAEASCPSATNTYVPGLARDDEKKKPEPEVIRMSNEASDAANSDIIARLDALEARNTVLESENVRLITEVGTLKDVADLATVRYQRNDLQSRLVAIDSDGVLDIDAEINDVLELPENLREKHIGKIALRYARDPMGGAFIPTTAPKAQRVPSESERKSVVNFMTRNKLEDMDKGRAAWNAAGCPVC